MRYVFLGLLAGCMTPFPDSFLEGRDGQRSLSVGHLHVCVLDGEAGVYCWGKNEFGAVLDYPLFTSTPSRLAVNPARVVTASNGFRNHTCIIDTDDALFCFGAGGEGQLGQGARESSNTPLRIGSATWLDVAAGEIFTCGIQTDQSVWCWGSGTSRQLATDVARALEPTATPLAGFTSIVAGSAHACALNDEGVLWCWGSNGSGQLGVEDAGPVELPMRWATVSAGLSHTCGVTRSGEAYCWGNNPAADARVQRGAPETVRTPLRVLDGADWLDISAGEAHSCAVRRDGSAVCWGANDSGQLGIGMITASEPRTDVLTTTPLQSIEAGTGAHTCAMDRELQLWCWGQQDQNGVAGTSDVPVPTLVPVP